MYRPVITLIVSICALYGAGKQTRTPTAPNAVEVAISSANIPAGGTVQLQFALTEPRPIMSTGGKFAMSDFSAWGTALWTPTGEACGVGTLIGGTLNFTAVDATGTLGATPDYPFLTLTMRVPSTLAAGSVIPFNWSPDTYFANAGTLYSLAVKPGTVTIGGSASISGVFPGGGAWPAGTVVRIEGSGFTSGTKLITNVKYSSISIQPNAILIALKSQTTLDGQSFTVQNPDRSTATFNAYLRGAWLKTPSKSLLRDAEYAFPLATHAIASLTTADVAEEQFQGLALQNPTTGPAVVTLTRGATSSMIVLPSGSRIVDTLSALLDGAKLLPGETVSLSSTAMIQIMGVNGDQLAQTLTPFVPKF